MQEMVTVKSKTENLLQRIIALEEHFEARPDNVRDMRHRHDLIEYAIFSPRNIILSSA